MMVTTHLAAMYDEAARLARTLHGTKVETNLESTPTVTRSDVLAEIERTFDRIDNLVEHARAELQDEYLRARDGWPAI